MKAGGATLATLVTWNALVETSKAVDQSSAVEFLIEGSPPGSPAGTSYSFVDHPIPGTSAFLRFKTWCNPDNQSYTTMKMECAGEVYGYGKIATTGRASLTATKEQLGREFTSVGDTPANPAAASVGPWTQGGYNYTMSIVIATTRIDPDPVVNIMLRCTCLATVKRQPTGGGTIESFPLTRSLSIEDYIIYRHPN